MKTNLKKLSGTVLTVGMMSAMSLTSFAATSVPMKSISEPVKLEAAQTISNESDHAGNANTAKKAMDGENISISFISKDGNINTEMTALVDFKVVPQKDGSYQLINEKTGEVVNITMAKSAVEIKK